MKSGAISPLAKYTLARLTMFVLVLIVVVLMGARGPLALGLALVLSMLASYVLLRNLREPAAESVANRVTKRLEKTGSSDAAVEDAIIEGKQAAVEQPKAE